MSKFIAFFYKPKNLFIIGFVITFLLTFSEVARGKHFNFMVFADSTRDFWSGISPYTPEWLSSHIREFLYTPIFSVLFTPFAFLPKIIAPFVWNLFNYSMYFAAIFTLPKKFTNEQKCRTFLYTFLILATTLLAFQYNVVVLYLFLFAYSLMERDKGFWAVLLIMISGFTKIYGIFQLALLLCYPKFWKNIAATIVIGVVLFALPLLKLSPSELLPYYGEWLNCLMTHQSSRVFDSVFFIEPFINLSLPYFRIIQAVILATLAVLFISNRKKYCSFEFRSQALGILMGFVILFSDSAEKHTYVIALVGYMLWYWNHNPRPIDKVLFWSNFILLVLVPIDVICPVPIMKFICYTLWLNIWVFLFTWLRMVYITFFTPVQSAHGNDPIARPNNS